MTSSLVVLTTLPSPADARRIAEQIVQRRLAACVQIAGPVRSVYVWEGKLEQSEEWQCFIKTSSTAYPELEAAITDMHPYDVPEIIALPVSVGLTSYLSWIDQMVDSPDLEQA